MVVQTTVKKWGNSFGIRLQKAIAENLNLSEGSEINIEVENGKLVITPAEKEPTLKELIDGINENNRHGEMDFGRPVGKEIW